MHPYTDMPDHSRVWIYQSDRVFTEAEKQELQQTFHAFVASWAAHGAALKASVELFYDRFIVVFLDENQAAATGCSIDKSVHLMQTLEQKYGVKLMDRMQLAWRNENGVSVAAMPVFEQLVEAGKIGPETIVFNNLVTDKAAFDQGWEGPLKNSWHSRMLPLSQRI